MILRLAALALLLLVSACQTPARGFRPRVIKDPAQCQRLAREFANTPDVIIDLRPDGSCIRADMQV